MKEDGHRRVNAGWLPLRERPRTLESTEAGVGWPWGGRACWLQELEGRGGNGRNFQVKMKVLEAAHRDHTVSQASSHAEWFSESIKSSADGGGEYCCLY